LFDCNCNCGNGNIHNGSNASNPVESSKALHQFTKKQTNDGLFDCNCNCDNGNIHNGSSGSGVGNGGGKESGGSSGNGSGTAGIPAPYGKGSSHGWA
jgi:hypothetical protein